MINKKLYKRKLIKFLKLQNFKKNYQVYAKLLNYEIKIKKNFNFIAIT